MALINGFIGSYEPNVDSNRRLAALRAGRVLVGDALRVIRAASGRRRSPPDAAGKQGGALTLINGFIGSYEPNVDSNRRLAALRAGRVLVSDALQL